MTAVRGGERGGEADGANREHVEQSMKNFSPGLFLLHLNEHCVFSCLEQSHWFYVFCNLSLIQNWETSILSI